jgi:hypothetical protein
MRKRVLGALATTSAIALTGAVPAAAGEPTPPEQGAAQQQPQQQQPKQAAAKPAAQKPKPRPRALPPGSAYLIAQIDRARNETWRWQRLMGKPHTASSFTARRSRSPQYRRWVLRLWQQRAATERRLANNPPRMAAWLCIHRHERHPHQGWATRTGNGFYGGLQMNISFQRTYGGWLLAEKGTANNWTAIEQIWVAERAYRSGRGFYPWPNTARYCRLI